MSDNEERSLLGDFGIMNNWGYQLPVDAPLVDDFIEKKHARLAAAERAQEAGLKLRAAAIRPFFELNHRLLAVGMEPVNNALLLGTKLNASVWINFRYRPAPLDKIQAAGFEDLVEKGHLVECHEVMVDTEIIPEKKKATFLFKLKDLIKECGIHGDVVRTSSGYVPNSFFHKERHRLLSVERNVKLQEILPASIYVS